MVINENMFLGLVTKVFGPFSVKSLKARHLDLLSVLHPSLPGMCSETPAISELSSSDVPWALPKPLRDSCSIICQTVLILGSSRQRVSVLLL